MTIAKDVMHRIIGGDGSGGPKPDDAVVRFTFPALSCTSAFFLICKHSVMKQFSHNNFLISLCLAHSFTLLISKQNNRNLHPVLFFTLLIPLILLPLPTSVSMTKPLQAPKKAAVNPPSPVSKLRRLSHPCSPHPAFPNAVTPALLISSSESLCFPSRLSGVHCNKSLKNCDKSSSKSAMHQPVPCPRGEPVSLWLAIILYPLSASVLSRAELQRAGIKQITTYFQWTSAPHLR